MEFKSKFFLLLIVVFLTSPQFLRSQCNPMPVEPACSGTLVTDGVIIGLGQTYYSNGGAVNISSIETGGTLILCSGNTTLSGNLNGGNIYIKTGATLTTAKNNIPSGFSLYNFGTSNFTNGLFINSANEFINGPGATITVTGDIAGNSCSLINYSSITATGKLGSWQNSGGVCQGNGARIEVTDVSWLTMSNWIQTPVGTSCLSYSGSATSNNSNTASANAGTGICQKVGATDEAGSESWGNATLTQNCVGCGAPPCNAADTALAASIPTQCTGNGTLDLDLYKGTSAAGTWSITGGPALYTATIAVDGHTFNFNSTKAGTYTVRHTLTSPGVTCATFSERSFTIDTSSVGGSITADATVCSGSNGATLNLAGNTGTISDWESSADNFLTATSLANTTTSQTYLNLNTSTKYRALVKSGVCPAETSSVATITVDPVSVGGSITPAATVCSGSNSGTLTLFGNTGRVLRWESSTDNYISINNISDTALNYVYTNLTVTTKFRAVVQSGTCPSIFSSDVTITVDSVSVAGTLTSSNNVCTGSNSGVLKISGYTGTIIGWESSTDAFVNTTSIANLNDSLIYNNLIQNTQYRVLIKSGVCSSTTSNSVTISVDPASMGGTITSDSTVCSGNNNGTLKLNGNVGSILDWESSTDNFATVSSLGNNSSSQNYSNLMLSTQYRAIVKSGTCSPDTSLLVTITIDPQSIAGSVSADDTVCIGINSGTLHLSGNIGTVVSWEKSEDNFLTSITIPSAADSLTYLNLSKTTQFRAQVKSGVCPSSFTSAVSISMDQVSVSISDKKVCAGSSTTFDAGAGYMDYAWSGLGSGNLPSTNASAQGEYIITVKDSLGCEAKDSATLTINPIPKPDLGKDTALCKGETVELHPKTSAALKYYWSPSSDTTATSFISAAGEYIVTVSDEINCTRSDTILVVVNDLPVAQVSNDTTMCNNGFDKRTLLVTYSNPLYQTEWSTSESNVNSIIIKETGSYWVKISDENSCSVQKNIEVSEFCKDYKFEWPNVITPNGDNINDVFRAINIDDSNFQEMMANIEIIYFQVYDRWGIKIFQSPNVLPRWDGLFNGQPAATGTYYWVISYKNKAGKEYLDTGYITLLR